MIEKDREFSEKVVLSNKDDFKLKAFESESTILASGNNQIGEGKERETEELGLSLSKSKGGEAFFIDASMPKTPPRQNKSIMVIEKEKDMRHRLKKDPIAKVMTLNADEYKNYKGKDNGLDLYDKKEQLTHEEMMENAFNQYMSERQMYDGKFNPTEGAGDPDNGYQRYKKIFVD